MAGDVSVELGFHDTERPHVAALYWQAFGAKLGKVMGPEPKALTFFERVVDPDFALVARNDVGAVLGLAGFKTADGGLVDGGLSDLAGVYGWIGALWRAVLLAPLERKLQPGVFQMDGIFVGADARGQGVGTLLLDAVIAEAARRGLDEVQLDVIDTNPRARALYERVGFRAVGTEETGPLRHLFGFRSATRMSRRLSP